MAQEIKLHKAIAKMRELSDKGIPFSFKFQTCNTTKGETNGYKKVDKALLRIGFSPKQSDKHKTLIAYTDLTEGDKNRFFYLPLLFSFNGIKVIL